MAASNPAARNPCSQCHKRTWHPRHRCLRPDSGRCRCTAAAGTEAAGLVVAARAMAAAGWAMAAAARATAAAARAMVAAATGRAAAAKAT
eukprot:scaffold78424_cov30-Phaeocystis_antarctica.AAC.1